MYGVVFVHLKPRTSSNKPEPQLLSLGPPLFDSPRLKSLLSRCILFYSYTSILHRLTPNRPRHQCCHTSLVTTITYFKSQPSPQLAVDFSTATSVRQVAVRSFPSFFFFSRFNCRSLRWPLFSQKNVFLLDGSQAAQHDVSASAATSTSLLPQPMDFDFPSLSTTAASPAPIAGRYLHSFSPPRHLGTSLHGGCRNRLLRPP